MRKSILFLTSAVVSLMLAFSACSGDSNDDPVSVSAVTLNKSELQLSVGSAETLKATLSPDNAADKELRWTSGDADIASVSGDGLVTAMAKGATSITVKTNDGGHRATCAVTVYTIPVTSFTLDTNSLTLFAGATHTFTKNILPENASDKGVIWHCSNDYVASVSNEGVVTALGSGAAIITATTRDGGYRAACSITIYEALDIKPDVTLNKEYMFLDLGQTEKLTATITRENAPDKTVTWSSSNPDIASVSSDGLVTAKTKGTVDITVKANSGGKIAVCSVGVAPPLDVPPVRGDVFVAGYYEDEFGVVVATLWKNGVPQPLSSLSGVFFSVAMSVFVSGDDVYVAGSGSDDINRNGNAIAILWKNGVPVILSNAVILGNAIYSEANSVFVSDNDIYVAGEIIYSSRPNDITATLWKNGVFQKNFGDITNQTIAKSVFVSGEDVYVVVNDVYSIDNGVFAVTTWKNSMLLYITPSYPYAQNWATSIFVSGKDVYVVGLERLNLGSGPDVAKLWKNGEGIRLTDGNYSAHANSCYAIDDDVYIVGFEEFEDGRIVATVWKNTKVYQRLSDGNEDSTGYSIFVSGNDVYVAGRHEGTSVVWKNGVPYFSTGSSVFNSVFVVE